MIDFGRGPEPAPRIIPLDKLPKSYQRHFRPAVRQIVAGLERELAGGLILSDPESIDSALAEYSFEIADDRIGTPRDDDGRNGRYYERWLDWRTHVEHAVRDALREKGYAV